MRRPQEWPGAGDSGTSSVEAQVAGKTGRWGSTVVTVTQPWGWEGGAQTCPDFTNYLRDIGTLLSEAQSPVFLSGDEDTYFTVSL